jgi:uncharacterized membrane protein YgcG
MPDAFELHEARRVQERFASSAADALSVSGLAVPEGKVHTVRFINYTPSTAETRTVYAAVVGRSTTIFSILRPASIALSTSIRFAALEQGNELKLYPGEYIVIYRDVATAGSSMYVWWSFIESDLPYYAYEEVLKKVVRTSKRHGVFGGTAGGAIAAGSDDVGGGGRPGGGRDSSSKPI